MFHVRWVTVMRENVWSLTTDSEWKHSLTLRVLFTLKHCEVLRLPEVKKCSRHLTLKCVDRDDFCAVATREEMHASPLNVCVGRLKAIYMKTENLSRTWNVPRWNFTTKPIKKKQHISCVKLHELHLVFIGCQLKERRMGVQAGRGPSYFVLSAEPNFGWTPRSAGE